MASRVVLVVERDGIYDVYRSRTGFLGGLVGARDSSDTVPSPALVDRLAADSSGDWRQVTTGRSSSGVSELIDPVLDERLVIVDDGGNRREFLLVALVVDPIVGVDAVPGLLAAPACDGLVPLAHRIEGARASLLALQSAVPEPVLVAAFEQAIDDWASATYRLDVVSEVF